MYPLEQALQPLNIDLSRLTRLSYPEPAAIYHLPIPFDQRSLLWMACRSLVPQVGYWPVICVDSTVLDSYHNHTLFGTPEDILQHTYTEVLSQTLPVSIEALINQVTEAIIELYEDDERSQPSCKEFREELEAFLALPKQPASSPSITLDEHLGLTFSQYQSWQPEAAIVFFPTPHWWEIPALIRYFPTDPGPSPLDYVQRGLQWAQRYGAELTCFDPCLHLRMLYPPATTEEAFRLAYELYCFCEPETPFGILEQAQMLFEGKALEIG